MRHPVVQNRRALPRTIGTCLAVLGAASCSVFASAAPARAEATDAATPAVHVAVVVVRASGKPAPDGPRVSEELATVRLPWPRLGFGSYERERVVEQDAAWDEKITIDYDGGGRYSLTPSAPEGDGAGHVRVEQHLPGDEDPCLVTEVPAVPKRRHLPFCNVELDGTTWLFVVSASPLRS